MMNLHPEAISSTQMILPICCLYLFHLHLYIQIMLLSFIMVFLLMFCLHLLAVYFSCFTIYLSICLSMGTICAPTYANTFMSEFEERYIDPLIKIKSSSYVRFIDDIFMVWTKSENELKSFINERNKKHHSIKFDFKFSKEKIDF